MQKDMIQHNDRFMINEEKKKLGKFYTSTEVVDYILDCIGFSPEANIEEATILDASCGNGIFLVRAASRLIARFERIGFDLTHHDDAKAVLEAVINNIHGIDIDAGAVDETRKNLLSTVQKLYQVVRTEEKEYLVQFKIFCFDALLPNELDSKRFDYVLGNPPYVRIQRIKPNHLRERYKTLFESALGRFDTSVLFMEKGIKWLKPSGTLGYIVSDRFMTTNYGKGVRGFILKSSSIKHIFDLTDIEPFEVSVLPCILILKKEKLQNEHLRYCAAKKARQSLQTKTVSDLFKYVKEHFKERNFTDIVEVAFNGKRQKMIVQCFDTDIPSENNTWSFVPPNEFKIVDKIKRVKTHFLDELTDKINVGIKTTANPVFADLVTRDFIEKHALEKQIVHPCLRGANVHRWKTVWDGNIEKKDTFLIYPHEWEQNKIVPVDLDKYPNAKKYLESHKKELEERYYLQEAGRKWYEIWVHQHPNDFDQEYKIVTSDLSSHNTFAVDENRFFCLDSCYYIILKEKSADNYKFLLGLLNSKVLEFIHKRVCSTHVYSNKYRYMTSYMKRYPIVFEPDGVIGKRIVALVEEILKLSRSSSAEEKMIEVIEEKLDQEVYRLYQLDATDQSVIESVLETR